MNPQAMLQTNPAASMAVTSWGANGAMTGLTILSPSSAIGPVQAEPGQ